MQELVFQAWEKLKIASVSELLTACHITKLCPNPVASTLIKAIFTASLFKLAPSVNLSGCVQSKCSSASKWRLLPRLGDNLSLQALYQWYHQLKIGDQVSSVRGAALPYAVAQARHNGCTVCPLARLQSGLVPRTSSLKFCLMFTGSPAGYLLVHVLQGMLKVVWPLNESLLGDT